MNVYASIDLNLALKKIATRQTLNDVHFLVQLIRHALERAPRSIQITEHNGCWSFTQNGEPPNPLEVSAIRKLMNGVGGLTELKLLETRFGIALLSCFVNFKNTRLSFMDSCLEERDSKLTLLAKDREIPGYQLTFNHPEKLETDPLQELRFYCSNMEIPLTFNSQKVNHTQTVPPLLLQSTWENDRGKGLVGIPDSGSDSTFHFYKNGVRFGVKHFSPEDGRIFYGYWNVPGRHYEQDFEKSIETALNLLQQQGRHLYKNLSNYFGNLDEAGKIRIKQVLLNVPRCSWEASFSSIPLFNLSKNTFNLSLLDIHDRIEKQLSLSFHSTLTNPRSNNLPTLTPEDVYFLKEKMGLPLRMLKNRVL